MDVLELIERFGVDAIVGDVRRAVRDAGRIDRVRFDL
jgi:hypothetical protein